MMWWAGGAAPLLAQQAPVSQAAGATISVTGAVPHSLTLSAVDIDAMPRQSVRAGEHGQPESTYDGVLLRDVLARAGVQFGSAIRGPALATYVLCSAADGYHVVFALAELDSAFSDRPVILADHKDAQPLDARTGPFRIVVPGDARGARWIRQLTAIAVIVATAR
jgi:DMSO/TMAO reductase YedYZ molybdopterin-dependent catalytic subunit